MKIIVVGCGVVGALIAYELSQQVDAEIVVLDRQKQPAQASTGAALGVLMGAISGKVKGRTWQLREASIRRYRSLISELTAKGQVVPFNRQGIVSLCYEANKLPRWVSLKGKRETQGWPLEIWSPEQLQAQCPHIDIVRANAEDESLKTVKAAIYSPSDAQVHPVQLTHALVSVARSNGVTFCWNAAVKKLMMNGLHCVGVQTTERELAADWVVLAAGLGSAALSQIVSSQIVSGEIDAEPLALMPVLGQAMEIQLSQTLGKPDFQPVINGDDIQFVPLGEGRYWIGATVEFPDADSVHFSAESIKEIVPEADGLAKLKKGAEGFCGAIAHAKILKTWSGLRPRPVGQPAPVIKPLGNIKNVTLATGHYRNGVLLAPATAQQICNLISDNLFS